MKLNQFPYSDFHEMNLDWIIDKIKELANSFEEFKVLNTITFAGVWDISKNYPKFAIVSNASGDAYISNKPVPAGISLDNESYWMKLYNFVSALGTLTGRVTTLEGTVSNIAPRVTSLESSVSDLNPKVKSLVKEDWINRSVLFVGDSYLDGYNGSTSVKTYSDYINDYLHFGHYYKASQGGAGFGTSVGVHYLTRLQTWVNSQTSAVLNGITDVYIMGGYNDKDSSETDIITGTYGINNTVSYIKSKMPNAKITLGFLGRALYTPVAMTFAKMQSTVKAYRKGAIQAGVHYLEGSELCLHDYTLFSSDHIHPTSAGYNQLGDYLTCLMLDKDFDYMYTDSAYGGIQVDFTGTSFTQMPTTIYQGLTRNACTLDSYGGQYTFTAPIPSWQASYANEVNIGNFKTASTANYFMPKYSVYMNVPVAIQHSSGVSNVDGTIVFKSNGEIAIAINSLQSGSWNFNTFTNVSKIMIGKGTVNIPIEYC